MPRLWVAPGQTLQLPVSGALQGAGEGSEVVVLAQAFGGGAQAPTARLAGQELALGRDGDRVRGAVRTSELPEAWSIEVSSPAEGPWVLLDHVWVASGPRAAHLVGLPETARGASLRLVGGRVDDTLLAPQFAAPPPSPRVGGKVKEAPRETGVFTIPRYAALADAPRESAGHPHDCSPLRVLEDGEPLEHPNVSCAQMADLRAGRSCHAGDLLFFTASDATVPYANGRDYTLSFADDRLCDRRNQQETTPLRGSLWLYPGDVATLTPGAEGLRRAQDGLNRLEIALDPVRTEGGDQVVVQLWHGGTLHLEQALVAGRTERLYRDLPLDRPLPAGATDVRLVLENRGGADTFWLLTMATLSEDRERWLWGRPDDVPLPPLASTAAEAEAVSAERVGKLPVLPPLRRVERREDGLVEGRLPELAAVSALSLQRAGWPAWTPLRLSRGEVALSLASQARLKEGRCEDCFGHFGRAVVARVPGEGTPRLAPALEAAVPWRLPDGRAVWWLYPDTALRWGPSDPRAAGPVRVRVRAHIFEAARRGGELPVLRVAGVEASLEPGDGAWEAEVTLDAAPEGPLHVELAAGPLAPWTLVEALWVQDAAGVRRWALTERPPAVAPEP